MAALNQGPSIVFASLRNPIISTVPSTVLLTVHTHGVLVMNDSYLQSVLMFKVAIIVLLRVSKQSKVSK